MNSVVVNSISKKFKIGLKGKPSALRKILATISGKEITHTLWALKEVSFKAKQGEILGIIGNNGSGKSTLLRAIAGIYKMDKGDIQSKGKVISLINLHLGMVSRLTMIDNITLTCSLFGLSRTQTKKQIKSIIDFSELHNFINAKLYQFSIGMRQRLAFSVAIHCKPDILLLDEVFEVGDAGFREKSANRIIQLSQKGTTVLLVSHDLPLIQKYCSNAILMNQGTLIKQGTISDVLQNYKTL